MERNVFVWGNSAFVTYKFLYQRKVPSDVVYKNTTKASKKRWYIKKHGSLKLIAYDSIPIDFIEKYKLPNLIELREINEIESQKLKLNREREIPKILRTILDFAYDSWESITDIYKNEYFDEKTLESFCKTHLILSEIVELSNSVYKLTDLHKAYIQYDGLVFETISYHSFCNKIGKIKKSNCIEHELIHGLRKQESNNHRMSEDIIQEIQRLYSDPTKPCAREIHKELKNYLLDLNRKPISLPSVERLIAQTWFKNECMYSRQGDKYTEEHLLPYLPFESPNFEESLWLIDGTRFQFVYKTEKSKYNFLSYFIILEGKTRKIIGYSYDDSENHVMVSRALKMACTSKGFLPKEIISDRSSAYKAVEFARIISNLRDWGVIWRMAKHPRDNGYVERCFGVIQTVICKNYDGYLGDGIKSKNIDGKSSPEEIKKFLSNKNLRTRNELLTLIDKVIAEYNLSKDEANSNRIEDVTSKSTIKKVEPIKLTSIRYSKLFWDQIILTMHNSIVSFTINKKDYYFIIYSKKVIYNYGGNKVRVRYNKSDLSLIMLFDLNSDEFIIKVKRIPGIHKPLAERDKEEKSGFSDHVRKKKYLKSKIIKDQQVIQERSDLNRDLLPPELSQILPASKIEQQELEDELLIADLNALSSDDTFKVFTTDDSISYDELFKNLYKKKGTLKIFNHGNN